MDWTQTLKAVFALAIVLGLILGLSVILRRYGPQFLAQMSSRAGRKRLSVVETLVLDPARRLVLVRIDDQERLILLGEGHDLGTPRQTALKDETPSDAAPTSRQADPAEELF